MTRSHSGSRRCLPDLSPPRAASFPCSRQSLVKAADPRMETRCPKIISREDQGSSAQASGARSSSDVDSAPGTSHSSKWAGERNQRSPQNGTSAPRAAPPLVRARRQRPWAWGPRVGSLPSCAWFSTCQNCTCKKNGLVLLTFVSHLSHGLVYPGADKQFRGLCVRTEFIFGPRNT